MWPKLHMKFPIRAVVMFIGSQGFRYYILSHLSSSSQNSVCSCPGNWDPLKSICHHSERHTERHKDIEMILSHPSGQNAVSQRGLCIQYDLPPLSYVFLLPTFILPTMHFVRFLSGFLAMASGEGCGRICSRL